MPKRYAEVVVNLPVSEVDRLYYYDIPNALMEKVYIGSRVLVEFSNRKLEGYVVGIKESDKMPDTKPIIEVLEPNPPLNESMVMLSMWMKERYLCPLIDSLKCLVPPMIRCKITKYLKLSSNDSFDIFTEGQRRLIEIIKNKGMVEYKKAVLILEEKEILTLINRNVLKVIERINTGSNIKKSKFIKLNVEGDFLDKVIEDLQKRRAYKQIEAINYLKNRDCISENALIKDVLCSSKILRILEKKGIISVCEREALNSVCEGDISHIKYPIKLLEEQETVLRGIIKNIKEGKRKFLIHGVTGSGKTEIYIEIIDYFIKQGKNAILLVPEIILTPQTIERFKNRFNNIAVLHSKLSARERFEEWLKIRNGDVKVAIGTRSAVFAPFENLGVIIIDEEHSTSYKQTEINPKYHAVEVAEKRSELENAVLIMGSATPSVENYYRGLRGDLEIYTLTRRIGHGKLPKVEIVDMREEFNGGNRSIFSRKLYQSIREVLSKREQVILYINRKGYATFVSCRKCGHIMKCPNCDISLVYYMGTDKLRCHYCNFEIANPEICPSCKSNFIRYFGIGTERVEKDLKTLFPESKIQRMDLETTRAKDSYSRILKDFKEHKIDILVGTQMISKGLDFPNVTLVGVIIADTLLNLPDFRAAERTFQLLAQVAGRAGRGMKEGKVIIQTYSPEHYSVIHAMNHDYKGFVREELKIRELFGYPPFTYLLDILVVSEEESLAREVIHKIYDKVFLSMQRENILGPAPAFLYKIRNRYRYRLILKERDTEKLISIARMVRNMRNTSKVNIYVDINPINVL